MAREYLKALIESTVVRKGTFETPESTEEVDSEEAEIVESNHSMGLRSPGGPMRGRSVKEFEEQLAGLKKENFNLKLRIYFLEERMGSNFNLDKENVVKKNVELMVEVESLRKELQEKHDLLCQAVKAMELEDEEHKKLLTQKEEVMNDYQQEIEHLKTQLLDIRPESGLLSPKSYHSDAADMLSAHASTLNQDSVVRELQEKIASLEEELNHEKENNAAVQMVLDQTDSRVRDLTIRLEEASRSLSGREDDLEHLRLQLDESQNRCQNLHQKLQDMTHRAEELSNENEQLRKRQSLLTSDCERERKRSERLKSTSDLRAAELQTKLEAALAELKKSQELVVASPRGTNRPPAAPTDADSISVQKPAASPRSPQKDAFLPISVPSSVTTSPSSPSLFHLTGNNNSTNGGNNNSGVVVGGGDQSVDLLQQKIVKLKAEQMKACKIIKSMIDSKNKTNEEMDALKRRNEELERELEGVVSKLGKEGSQAGGDRNENSMEDQGGELIEHYKALTEELEEKNRILVATLTEKDSQMKKAQEQYEEVFKLNKAKEEHIVDLEFELLASQEKTDKSTTDLLQEKQEEIERLKEKLLKKNCDLQGLVNNELWEKNREIEKLHTRHALKTIETRDREIEKLQHDLKTKESQLGIIKEKISELGIDISLHEGGVSVESHLQEELEKSERLRLEANEVCGVLSKRLEELAVFLDSLLKQKSVLGFLGHKENKRLRQIIDQSLDLSRSFTMSMIVNPEQSLIQLTNITSFLDDSKEDNACRLSLVPTGASFIYRSHLCKKENEEEENNAHIIQTLRQQIVNLKYELQLRDVELNKINNCGVELTELSSEKESHRALNTTSTTLKYKSDNQSESESWSEPDRSVSRARMGLLDGSLKSTSGRRQCSNTSTDSTEEDEGNQSKSSKKGILNESRNTILDLHQQMCQLDQKLNEKEMAYFEATKTNNKLRQELDHLHTKFRESEARIIEADLMVERLQHEKGELVKSLETKNKDLEQKMNQIEVEKREALNVAKEAELAAEMVRNEMKMAEMKLKATQQQISELEVTLRSEYETEFFDKLQKAESESVKKIKQIQNASELEMKTLRDTIHRLREEYSNNYVKKCEMEEALDEVDRLKCELDSMEERMDELAVEEERVKKKLAEYEERINGLRSDLDNATLQYSEAVLEKTQMANEKALLEQELSKSILKEVDTKKRLDEVENELTGLKQSHQKQISVLQMHKSKLEVRISELESSNAELHNRLIKIQAGCGGDHVTSTSLPSTPNFVNQIVSFRRQHSENSGYLSEDPMMLEDLRSGNGRSFSRLMIPNVNIDIERNEANSSPDLGIESDHGRFSSLETHVNVQRPLLQTLELTESMSNLLDMENNQIDDIDCGNSHCCQKTMEMAHENSDLKRKLLRTRRALEETVTQLTLANQRKKQVEKTICKQIHKTSQVLRKAKANLDSGSETDMYRK